MYTSLPATVFLKDTQPLLFGHLFQHCMVTLRSQEYIQASDPQTSFYLLLVMSLTLGFYGNKGNRSFLAVALILSGCEKRASAR